MSKTNSFKIWAAVTLCAGLSAHAGIIFSNLDGGGGYNGGAGQFAEGAGSSSGTFQAAAVAFTPSTNVDLGEIGVALSFFTGNAGDTDGATISISSDASGLPGAAIESWNVSGLPAFGSTSTTLQIVAPVGTLALTGGVQYWIVVTPETSTSRDVWNINDIGNTETTAREFGSGGWGINGTTPALEVLSSSAPEPSTFVLLSGALLVVFGRKFTSANRTLVFSEPISDAPRLPPA